MVGDKRWKSPEMKVRVELSRAQGQLWRAQLKRTRTMARGEIEVEKARRRAARQLAKATKRVERKAEKVAALESQLPPLPLIRTTHDRDDLAVERVWTAEKRDAQRELSEDTGHPRDDAVDGDHPFLTTGDEPAR